MSFTIEQWQEVGKFAGAKSKEFYNAGGTINLTNYNNIPSVPEIPAETSQRFLDGYASIKASLIIQDAPDNLNLYLAYYNNYIVGAASVLYLPDSNKIYHLGSTGEVPGIGTALTLKIAIDAVDRGVGISSIMTSDDSKWYWDQMSNSDTFCDYISILAGVEVAKSILNS